MSRLHQVPIHAMDPHRFSTVLSGREYEALLDLITHALRELHGRVIWNVNSTAKGGGVVELLRPLLGYSRGVGIDARWVVITAGPEFFAITKRIHNRLHGFAGDGGPLGAHEREVYERELSANAAELTDLIHPNDIVILHDPQTAGLAAAVRGTGTRVIWRCHVGLDHANEYAREAWDFLRGYVLEANLYVFSRAGFAWEGLPRDQISVIRPSIDAFSPKNADQTSDQTSAILSQAGIVGDASTGHATFTRSDGSTGRVLTRAQMVQEAPVPAGNGLVLQKSLAEGFGLTVSEAMWKSRAVVASRIGGIRDQITDGHSGVLLADPHDLGEAGRAIAGLLADADRARRIGLAAREQVRHHFLGPHHLGRYFEVIRRLIAQRPLPERLRESDVEPVP